MKKALALFMATAMFAPSAFAAEITPYIGLGLVIDKANTTAKRVAFDASKLDPSNLANAGAAFIPNAGSNMDFDMAFAGEITAGVKFGNVRAELEAAVRSASEDDYDIYNGNLNVPADTFHPMAGLLFQKGIEVPMEIENSISVRHNSYFANVYYDFELDNSNWTPYIGAGVGFGVYRQKATVEIDVDEDRMMALMAGQLAGNPMADTALPIITAVLPEVLGQIEREMEVANDTLYEFEWQVGLGAVYNFNEDWAVDVGYRFNSSTVEGEFVYAHEIKLGARYSF